MATILARFNPRKPALGDVVQVSIVVRHPMEPGTRRDGDGNPIEADYINHMEISFDGEHLATVNPHGGVSANPLFGFKMTAEKEGDLVIKYTDLSGETGEKTVSLKLAS